MLVRFRKTAGFTLIELVIVIVIAGILAAVSVPIYHSFIKRAMMTEGMTYIANIYKAEEIWLVEHDTYHLTTQAVCPHLDVDSRGCKYYYGFSVYDVSGSASAGNAAMSIQIYPRAGTDAEGLNITARKEWGQPIVYTLPDI